MSDSAATTSQVYTPAEAGELLRCSPDQVIALIKSGRLGAVSTSLGNRRARWVIPKAAIDAFLSPAMKVAKATRKPVPQRSGRGWLKK